MTFAKSTHALVPNLTVAELRFVLSSTPDDAIVSIENSETGVPFLVVEPKE